MATPPIMVTQGELGSLLRFRIVFDELQQRLLFEDLSQGLYDSHGYSDVKGLLWINHSVQGLIYINDGYNVNSFVAPDTSEDDRVKSIPLAVIYKGQYVINYKVQHGDKISLSSKSYAFNLLSPSLNLDKSVNYDISVLNIEDISNYQVSSELQVGGGKVILPAMIKRALTVQPPLGVPMAIYYNEDAPQKVVIGPPIYTHRYQIELASTLVYQLEKWDNNYWVEWKFVSKHYDYVDVEFESDCISGYIACIYQLSERLIEARGRSHREADYYERLVYDITFYYGLYQMYKQAGLDTGYACEKIMTILKKECTLWTEKPNVPQKIEPIYDIGEGTPVPGTPGTKWYSGTGTPSDLLGDNGDFYLQTINGHVYKKDGGTWILLMILSLKGKRIVKIVTSNYTMSAVDDTIFVRSGNTPVSIILPVGEEGDSYTIVADWMISQISVMPQSGTIEKKSVYDFGTEGDSITVVFQNTNWKII